MKNYYVYTLNGWLCIDTYQFFLHQWVKNFDYVTVLWVGAAESEAEAVKQSGFNQKNFRR